VKDVSINFDVPIPFELDSVRQLGGIVGLYFIFTKQTYIQYPFQRSWLLYIGMSERKTNSVSSRLTGHFDGKSKNVGLSNYRKVEPLFYTYLNYEMLNSIWSLRIEDLESYFILDFVKEHGVYPICNNKTGFEVLKTDLAINFKIDWDYFK
jgi:hypothetical protein